MPYAGLTGTVAIVTGAVRPLRPNGINGRTREHMKTKLRCPCGLLITAKDEDELVELTQQHLAESHPGMTYERDEILFIAY
jgi:hypothetical protein